MSVQGQPSPKLHAKFKEGCPWTLTIVVNNFVNNFASFV